MRWHKIFVYGHPKQRFFVGFSGRVKLTSFDQSKFLTLKFSSDNKQIGFFFIHLLPKILPINLFVVLNLILLMNQPSGFSHLLRWDLPAFGIRYYTNINLSIFIKIPIKTALPSPTTCESRSIKKPDIPTTTPFCFPL